MIASALALIVLAVVVLIGRRTRPAAGQARPFAATLTMLSGAVLGVTAGLCALAGLILFVAFLRTGAETSDFTGRAMLMAMPAGCALLAALGIWMYRRGRARVTADAARD